MAPQIQQMQYYPGQMMAQVGAAYDQDANNRMQANVQDWTNQHMAPVNALNWYMGALGGPGGSYGTQTQTSQQPFNLMGMLGGLGLLGSQMFF
jgi:hypothetical protein